MHNTSKILAFAAAALLFFSCSSNVYDEGNDNNSNDDKALSATQEALASGGNVFIEPTRAAMSHDGTQVAWDKGDAINVFDGTSNKKYEATSASGTSATFTAQEGVSTGAGHYVAVYPYDMSRSFSADGTVSGATLPQNQVATAGSFDPACCLMMATADTKGSRLAFKHVYSYLKVRVGKECSRLVLEFDKEAAGTFSVSMTDGVPTVSNVANGSKTVTLLGDIAPGNDYYVAVLPGDYSSFKATMELKPTKANVDFTKKVVNLNSRCRQANRTLSAARATVKSLGTLTEANTTALEGQTVAFEWMGYGDDPTDESVTHGTAVLWAKANVGATSETEDGSHFAWGETVARTTAFTYENYLCKDYYPSTLDPAHDAAAVNFGKGWRTPSETEFAALKENAIWVYTTTPCEGYYVYPAGKTESGKEVKDYQKIANGSIYQIETGVATATSQVTDEDIITYINALKPDNTTHLFFKFAGAIHDNTRIEKCSYWTNGHGDKELFSETYERHAAYYLGADKSNFRMNSTWDACFNGMTVRPVMTITW